MDTFVQAEPRVRASLRPQQFRVVEPTHRQHNQEWRSLVCEEGGGHRAKVAEVVAVQGERARAFLRVTIKG